MAVSDFLFASVVRHQRDVIILSMSVPCIFTTVLQGVSGLGAADRGPVF